MDRTGGKTRKEQIPSLLLLVDFEKAFDSVEWSFIEKTLKYYNFGTSLIAWVKLFYTDISSCIQNNGWSCDFFTLSRGVRQGCPLSPCLFICLCAEILGSTVMLCLHLGIYRGKHLLTKPWYICTVFILAEITEVNLSSRAIKDDHDQIGKF